MAIVDLLARQGVTIRPTVFVGSATELRTEYMGNNASETEQDTEMPVVEFALLGPEGGLTRGILG